MEVLVHPIQFVLRFGKQLAEVLLRRRQCPNPGEEFGIGRSCWLPQIRARGWLDDFNPELPGFLFSDYVVARLVSCPSEHAAHQSDVPLQIETQLCRNLDRKSNRLNSSPLCATR